MKLVLSFLFICVFLKEVESITLRKKQSASEECVCLHGGTCVYYRIYKRPYRCVCQKGYAGEQCEIDTKAICYNDRGHDYRGTASKTSGGHDCLAWDSHRLKHKVFNTQKEGALKLGLGKHNFCRNPDKGSKPWCYFKNGRQIQAMFCDLPNCEIEKSPDSTCGQRQHKMYKVVGGSSTSIESHPWLATLYQTDRRRQEKYVCGASLINPCWVLTAAHCFSGSNIPEPKDFSVILGKSLLFETNKDLEQKFQVEKIILHSEYSDETGAHNNDIALIKIRSPSGKCASLTDSVQTICLPPSGLQLSDATKCEVAGFGKEHYNNFLYSEKLKSVQVEIISQSRCQSEDYYGNLVNNNMFCAGDPEWKVDACSGDSGGPLICEHNGQMILYGIISWGDECAKENKPGVYTRVTKYLPWINALLTDNNKLSNKSIPK
ncbi:urokinase-type plasminogen activator [Bombina bombina]|uniref:urokinase-type plasminogen activator n=1 Tax=Bombina bombina TaxID=8345 RepID=UPI00235B08EB|nr:urokinase-type plasminogen activator [Bombina bombina]